jgi:hypothetical protein
MKSFNQFQQDSFFLMEAAADKFAAMDDKQFADYVSKNRGGAEKAKKLRDQGLKAKTTRVSGENIRGGTAKPQASSSAIQKVQSGLKTASNVKSAAEVGTVALKDTGKFGGVKKFIGKAAGPAAFALDTGLEAAAQKERGRKTGSALTIGATKAAGGFAGAKAGALTGAKFGSVLGPKGAAVGAAVGGIGGYLAGSGIAGKASETIAGATGKEKAAMSQANRQRQSGGAVAGIGGKTTFSKGKGGTAFMSTGAGKQRKTVQLDKTSVVRDAKGKEELGHLALKGGKAVYKRAAAPSTLAKTSSNWLERVGRTVNPGAYKAHDAAKKQQAIAKARQSDVKRQQKLGVKMKPAG